MFNGDCQPYRFSRIQYRFMIQEEDSALNYCFHSNLIQNSIKSKTITTRRLYSDFESWEFVRPTWTHFCDRSSYVRSYFIIIVGKIRDYRGLTLRDSSKSTGVNTQTTAKTYLSCLIRYHLLFNRPILEFMVIFIVTILKITTIPYPKIFR